MQNVAKKNGFTLVEVLVITILISISFMVFQRFSGCNCGYSPVADTATDIAIIKQAAAAYFARHGEYPICPENPDDDCYGLAYNDFGGNDPYLGQVIKALEGALQEESGQELPYLDPFRS